MYDIAINILLVVGFFSTLSFLILVAVFSYFNFKGILTQRKWFASTFIDNAIKTRLKGLSEQSLNNWFESIREKHKKINEKS